MPLVGRVEAWRSRGLDDRDRWQRALPTEVGFWDGYLAELAVNDTSRYRDPDYAWADEPVYRRAIELVDCEDVAVLDVGAGPMTAVPKVHPGKRIAITAFDPLADEYNAKLNELGIEPLVRTRRADGESILDHVAESSFDIAHASNCLDHAYDPAAAIRAMALAVRPGTGLVLLRHERNEGTRQHYLGLHQWNFDARGGQFVVWRPGTERNLSRELADLGAGEIWYEGREIVWVWRRA